MHGLLFGCPQRFPQNKKRSKWKRSSLGRNFSFATLFVLGGIGAHVASHNNNPVVPMDASYTITR